MWWVIEEVMIPTACSRNSNRDKDGKEIKKVGMYTLIVGSTVLLPWECFCTYYSMYGKYPSSVMECYVVQ